MPLDPQIAGLLKQAAAMGAKPLHEQSVAEARAGLAMMMALGARSLARPAVADRAIPGPGGELSLRIYTPEGVGPFAVLVFFHGGGFVLGDVGTHDGVCRELAVGAGCVVVSVDYRLAPEHKFPAAPDDAEAAVRWTFEAAASVQGDPTRVAIGGESAGANLAAVVAQRLRDDGGPAPVAQLLVYPTVQMSGAPTQSILDNAEGYLLTAKDMQWFLDQYLSDPADAANPSASPALATSLAGLPPALVITAEFDPLRDEGEEYAAALRAAGVEVKVSRYDGAIHGFWTFFGMLKLGREAMDESIEWLRVRLTTPEL